MSVDVTKTDNDFHVNGSLYVRGSIFTNHVGNSWEANWDLAEECRLLRDAGSGVTLAQVYPVGSIYFSVVSTNPATLFGFGTWAALAAGRMLVGLDSTDVDFNTVEETGGQKAVTPAGTISAPTFSGVALAIHSHSAGTLVPSAHSGTAVADHAAHTHSVTSNVSVAEHASHTHTYTQVVNHTHTQTWTPQCQGGITASTTGTNIMTSAATGGSLRSAAQTTVSAATANPGGGVATGTTAGPSIALAHSVTNNAVTSGNPSATLTHSVTQPSDHTMSGATTADSAGTPAGTISTPTLTGAQHTNLPPYLVVYMWKRTA